MEVGVNVGVDFGVDCGRDLVVLSARICGIRFLRFSDLSLGLEWLFLGQRGFFSQGRFWDPTLHSFLGPNIASAFFSGNP